MLTRLLIAALPCLVALSPALAQDADAPIRDATESCPDGPAAWETTTTFDVLFVQRGNTVGPLAVASQAAADPGAPVLTAGDLGYTTTPGVRLFQTWRGPDSSGFEIGYLGIWGMTADALAVSPSGSLALPGELGLVAGSGLDAATAIRPVLVGTLDSVEFNWFATRVHDGCRRHDPLPWRRAWGVLDGTVSTADWLLGIRWAGLTETATLDVTADAPDPSTTAYRVTTSSQLIGPQIGHRRRVEWGDWAVEGWAKAALVGGILSQSQGPVVGPFDLVEIRKPRSAVRGDVGMIGDLTASVVRRIDDRWSLRAGYMLVWLAGVAPAAAQWDFTNTTASGTGVATGTVFLHAATAGLEACW